MNLHNFFSKNFGPTRAQRIYSCTTYIVYVYAALHARTRVTNIKYTFTYMARSIARHWVYAMFCGLCVVLGFVRANVLYAPKHTHTYNGAVAGCANLFVHVVVDGIVIVQMGPMVAGWCVGWRIAADRVVEQSVGCCLETN